MTHAPTPPAGPADRDLDDGRLYSPAAGRNREVIAAILAERLPAKAQVLEIGSGSGEHGFTLCEQRRDVLWQPSDPDDSYRTSQAAWADLSAGNMAQPIPLDLLVADWSDGLEPVDALVCANVIHISPFAVAENLAARAGQVLKTGGFLYLYGPYLEGEKTAPSNLDFDASLRARDPRWGVRALDDVLALFAQNGFDLAERIDMPANNLSLIFKAREA